MSKYTDFFPLAGGGGGGGGSTEITDPTKLPLIMTQNEIRGEGVFQYENPNFAFFSMYQTGEGDFDESTITGASGTPILSTSSLYTAANATVNVTDSTEATILNVTGSGYLCNVASAVTSSAGAGVDGTITITIIVDGTTYTFSANPNSNTNTDNYYTRLLWGFHSKGNPMSADINKGNRPYYEGNSAQAAPGIMGFGNDLPIHPSTLLPPVNRTNPNGTTSGEKIYNLRVFSPVEFKNLNFPKLRFESSLVVKTQTNNLYTANAIYTIAGASYYLDSFNM
jgi:hypothetical protein